jgi:hypothetical protein
LQQIFTAFGIKTFEEWEELLTPRGELFFNSGESNIVGQFRQGDRDNTIPDCLENLFVSPERKEEVMNMCASEGSTSRHQHVHFTARNYPFHALDNNNFTPKNPKLRSQLLVNFAAGPICLIMIDNSQICVAEELAHYLRLLANNQENFSCLVNDPFWQECCREFKKNHL